MANRRTLLDLYAWNVLGFRMRTDGEHLDRQWVGAICADHPPQFPAPLYYREPVKGRRQLRRRGTQQASETMHLRRCACRCWLPWEAAYCDNTSPLNRRNDRWQRWMRFGWGRSGFGRCWPFSWMTCVVIKVEV